MAVRSFVLVSRTM